MGGKKKQKKSELLDQKWGEDTVDNEAQKKK